MKNLKLTDGISPDEIRLHSAVEIGNVGGMEDAEPLLLDFRHHGVRRGPRTLPHRCLHASTDVYALQNSASKHQAAPKGSVWHRARSVHIVFPAPSDARGRTGPRTLGLHMRPASCDWVP